MTARRQRLGLVRHRAVGGEGAPVVADEDGLAVRRRAPRAARWRRGPGRPPGSARRPAPRSGRSRARRGRRRGSRPPPARGAGGARCGPCPGSRAGTGRAARPRARRQVGELEPVGRDGACRPSSMRAAERSRPPRRLTSRAVNVTFYGVRGSCPCSGDRYRRYGGNTSCLRGRRRGGRAAHRRPRHRAARAGRRPAPGGAGPRDARCRPRRCSPTSTSTTSWASPSSARCTTRGPASTVLRAGAAQGDPEGRAARARCSRRSSRSTWSSSAASSSPSTSAPRTSPSARPRSWPGPSRTPGSPSASGSRRRVASVAYLSDHQAPLDRRAIPEAVLELCAGRGPAHPRRPVHRRRVLRQGRLGPLHRRLRRPRGRGGRGASASCFRTTTRRTPTASSTASSTRPAGSPEAKRDRGRVLRQGIPVDRPRQGLRHSDVSGLDQARFREVLGHFATGVTVVTAPRGRRARRLHLPVLRRALPRSRPW